MNNVLMLLLLVIVLAYVGFYLYLATMSLKTARDKGKLTGVAKAVSYPFILFAFLYDVIVLQLFVGTIIFAEWPKEWLFTGRVSRLNDRSDWRGRQARWWCEHFLDPFDPDGHHCD